MIIEKVVCDYLQTKLDCPVLPEKPKRPFGKMVFVERTGGRGRFIKESTVAIQSYDDSMLKAAELDEMVKELMFGITEIPDITHIELNATYNFTDTTTKEHRYQSVFDLTHY